MIHNRCISVTAFAGIPYALRQTGVGVGLILLLLLAAISGKIVNFSC